MTFTTMYIKILILGVLFIALRVKLTLEANASDNRTKATFISSEAEKGETNGSQTFRTEDEPWVTDAVRDVAYYLRSHKFTEWDRRYHPRGGATLQHGGFPRPPLRSLHWEVRQNCEPDDFLECLRYLHRTVRRTPLRRADDSAYFVLQNAAVSRNATISMNAECLVALKNDRTTGAPFAGPIERFQWRTTASVYMCRYTMRRRPALATFGEKCDNYASCLSAENNYNPSNGDPRADDTQPYACAEYSFCPDPCCPLRQITDIRECFTTPVNPCFEENQGPVGNTTCTVLKEENQDIKSMLLNYWNVSCACGNKIGYEWRSRYGICVDVDECLQPDRCLHGDVELCVNTMGNHTCVCRWGYERDSKGVCQQGEGSRMLDHDYTDDVKLNIQDPMQLIKDLVKKLESSSTSQKSILINVMISNVIIVLVKYI